MHTAELIGAQLDYWVAKAEDLRGISWDEGKQHVLLHQSGGLYRWYQPTVDWAQGGPIIDNQIAHLTRHSRTRWSAVAHGSAPGHGETALIAAMRAYVASKFGDDVPEENA